MKVIITKSFKRDCKRLHRNQIGVIEDVIDEIIEDPLLGELKKGDLSHIRVYKFHIHDQLLLLAYEHHKDEITLHSLGSHENFYRNLKGK